VSENKGNRKYPKYSYVRNIRYAKFIISVKNRGCPITKGVRKLRVITVFTKKLITKLIDEVDYNTYTPNVFVLFVCKFLK